MTIIPNDTLYVDTFSDFQCNATISEYVDTPTTIMYQWFATAGIDFTNTSDTLRVNRFSSSDNGRTITCMATVLPSSGQQYVLQNNANESIVLTVERECTIHHSTCSYIHTHKALSHYSKIANSMCIICTLLIEFDLPRSH